MQREYVATLRASFRADDDAQAILISEDMRERAEAQLEPDDGDEVVVTQVIDYAPADTPQEIINVLAKARNTLIKTKLGAMIDLAREVDKVIFALEHGDFLQFAPYDYGRFMELMEQVLTGGSPP